MNSVLKPKHNYDNLELKDFFSNFEPKYYLSLFKNYIIKKSIQQFDEETLSFFIILGALMYITKFIVKPDLSKTTTKIENFYLFDNYDDDFKLNNKIRSEIYKQSNRNYIPFFEDIIPSIINRLSKSIGKEYNTKIEIPKKNLSVDFSLLFFIESIISQNILNI